MMNKTLVRPAMIVIPLVLGIFLPQGARLGFLADPLLIGMLFAVFLQLELRELAPQPAHWIILVTNLAIGVGAYLLALATGSRELALAAFFIGITPTATAAPVIMNLLNGRVGFVVSGFVVTNLGVSLALIPLIPAVTGEFTFAFALRVLRNLLIVMALPLAAAQIVRRFHPAAAQWPKRYKMVSLAMWSMLLFIVSAKASKFLRGNTGTSLWLVAGIALAAALLCAANFTIGAFVVPKRFRREGSQTLGQKNTMLTMSLALSFASPLAALGPTFYVICHNFWNACQLFFFDRRRSRRAAKNAGTPEKG